MIGSKTQCVMCNAGNIHHGGSQTIKDVKLRIGIWLRTSIVHMKILERAWLDKTEVYKYNLLTSILCPIF